MESLLSEEELYSKLFNIVKQIGLQNNTNTIVKDTDLFMECEMDSVNLVEIALAIEEEFCIELDLFDLEFSNFKTVRNMAMMLKKL